MSDINSEKIPNNVNLGGDSAVGAGLSGLSAFELEDDEDQVLGEGSDVTLSGESSGINIISPSDSGLALDDVSLDLSGSSPIGSSLDLGDIAESDKVELEPLDVGSAVKAPSEDFQLTPIAPTTLPSHSSGMPPWSGTARARCRADGRPPVA